jgi:hypothetical protein
MTPTKLLVQRLFAFAVAIAAWWSATHWPRAVRSMNRPLVRRAVVVRTVEPPPALPTHRCDRSTKHAAGLFEGRKKPEHTRISGNPESARTQERQERLMKRRREFYVEEEVAERLATMAAEPGSSKTAIMTNALKAYFDFTALGPNSKRFRAWLGRLSVQLGRIERDRQIVAETSALLARFQLLVTTSLSDPDRAALPTAQERFKAFVEQVSRRVFSVAASQKMCSR